LATIGLTETVYSLEAFAKVLLIHASSLGKTLFSFFQQLFTFCQRE
jgi:hypothetical protein